MDTYGDPTKYSTEIMASALLLNETETCGLLSHLPPDPYSSANLDSAFPNSRSLKLSLELMWVELTSILLYIPLSLKIPKSPHIMQEATVPCQGKRPRPLSCLINYILRPHCLFPIYFSCIKSPNGTSSFCLVHRIWVHDFTHPHYHQCTKLKGKKIWTMKWYIFFLTQVQLCMIKHHNLNGRFGWFLRSSFTFCRYS